MANVTEAAGENGSIVLDYQYEQNVHSDSQFLQEAQEAEAVHGEPVIIVTDGHMQAGRTRNWQMKKTLNWLRQILRGGKPKTLWVISNTARMAGK